MPGKTITDLLNDKEEQNRRARFLAFQAEVRAAEALLSALNNDKSSEYSGFNEREISSKREEMAHEQYRLAEVYSKESGVDLPIDCLQAAFSISLKKVKDAGSTFFKIEFKKAIARAEKDLLELLNRPNFDIDDEKFKPHQSEIDIVLRRHYQSIREDEKKLGFHNQVHKKMNERFYSPFHNIINEARKRDPQFPRAFFVKKIRLKAEEKYSLALRMNVSEVTLSEFKFMSHRGKTALLLRLISLCLSYVNECYLGESLRLGALKKAGIKTSYKEWHDQYLNKARGYLIELLQREDLDVNAIDADAITPGITRVLDDLQENSKSKEDNKRILEQLASKFGLNPKIKPVFDRYKASAVVREPEPAQQVSNSNNAVPPPPPNDLPPNAVAAHLEAHSSPPPLPARDEESPSKNVRSSVPRVKPKVERSSATNGSPSTVVIKSEKLNAASNNSFFGHKYNGATSKVTFSSKIGKEELFACENLEDFRSKRKFYLNGIGQKETAEISNELLIEWRKQSKDLANAVQAAMRINSKDNPIGNQDELEATIKEFKDSYNVYLTKCFDSDSERSEAINIGNNLLKTLRDETRDGRAPDPDDPEDDGDLGLLDLRNQWNFEEMLHTWYLTLFVDSDDVAKKQAREKQLHEQWINKWEETQRLLNSSSFNNFEKNFSALKEALNLVLNVESIKAEFLDQWRSSGDLKKSESLEDFNLKARSFVLRYYPKDIDEKDRRLLVEDLLCQWREEQFQEYFGVSKKEGLIRGLDDFIRKFYGGELEESEQKGIVAGLWDKWRAPKKEALMRIEEEDKFQEQVEAYLKQAYPNLDEAEKSELKHELGSDWRLRHEGIHSTVSLH